MGLDLFKKFKKNSEEEEDLDLGLSSEETVIDRDESGLTSEQSSERPVFGVEREERGEPEMFKPSFPPKQEQDSSKNLSDHKVELLIVKLDGLKAKLDIIEHKVDLLIEKVNKYY